MYQLLVCYWPRIRFQVVHRVTLQPVYVGSVRERAVAEMNKRNGVRPC